MRYTFETKHLSETWVRSGQERATEAGAIRIALEWVETCLENGTAVAVRIVTIK